MKKLTPILLFVLMAMQLVAQQQEPSLAPINQEFIEYESRVVNKEALNKTAEGYYLGERPSPARVNFVPVNQPKKSRTIPASYDLRTVENGAYLSPVRDQGEEGACWSFATYGAVESYILRQGSGQFDFSEQNLATCHNFDWTPSDGGNYSLSAAYLARNSGPISEADDPYTLPLNPNCVSGLTPSSFVQQAHFLPGINDNGYSADVIKQAIMDYGAVYVNLRQESDYINNSDYTYFYNGSDVTNHAVLLVGWDDNKVVTGGTAATPTNNGAWIIRNSWGPSWGESGFYYVSYEDTKALSSVAIFPSDLRYNASEVAFGYDEMGWVGAIGYSDETDYGLVKFTTNENIELTKVGLFVPSGGATVDFTVYSTFNGTSLSGELGSISNQTCTYPGYHSFNLSSAINISSGSDFYIKAKVNTPGYNYPIATEYVYDGYSSNVTIETGKYWLSSNGVSWTALGGTTGNDYDLCIKAYGNTTTLAANFTADKTRGNAPLQVQFSDISTGNITSWSWDFDNNGTVESTEQNPSYTFSEVGIYTVALTVSDGTNTLTETKTAYITVTEEFLMKNGSFTTNSGIFYDDGGSENNYSASLNDTLVFYPETAGTYLSFDFTAFETESSYDFLYIYNGSSTDSILLFTLHGTHEPFNVVANNTEGALTFVFISDGGIQKTGWSANISTINELPAIYLMKTGSYTVSNGKFYDEGGLYDDYGNNVDDTLTFFPSVAGEKLGFSFSSFNTESGWDYLYAFDGTNTSATQIGTYNGTSLPDDILATNADGAITFVFHSDGSGYRSGWEADISMTGQTNTLVADFTSNVTSGEAPLLVQFTDVSTGNPTSWSWDFNNDGTVDATDQNPSYTYTSGGDFTVKLTVSDGTNSISETKTNYISVSNPVTNVTADFTSDVTSGTVPLVVQFADASSNNVTSWIWDFNNDGTIDATGQNPPAYTYESDGMYTVKLSVGNGTTFVDEIKTNYITVYPATANNLFANFEANITNGIASHEVQFTNKSTGGATSWSWDFNNDGTVDASSENPSYTYDIVGAYSVKLTISDGINSKDTLFTDYINVMAQPDTFNTHWEWQNPLPQGNRLNKAFKVNSDTLYVTGDAGVVLRSFNGGSTWEQKYIGQNLWMYSIHFINGKIGYVTGEDAVLYKTMDAGETWSKINHNIPTSYDIYDVWFMNQNDGIAITTGKIYKTTNGGFTWQQVLHPGTSSYKNDVYFIDESTGFVLGGNSNGADLLKTIDGGNTWTQQIVSADFKQLNAVYFTSPTIGYAAGDNDEILKTTDSGNTWTQYTFSESIYTDFESIFFTDANTGYATGGYKIYKTTDAGASWVSVYSTYGEDFHSMVFTNTTNGFVFGNAGIINTTTDAGASWEFESNKSINDIKAIDFATPEIAFAVANGGPILKTINGGSEWTENTSTNYYLFDVDAFNADTIIGVGSSGKVLVTYNGGESWNSKTSGTSKSLYTVQNVNGSVIYAAGYQCFIKSVNGGESWANVSFPYDKYVQGIYFSDVNTGVAVGGEYNLGKIYRTINGGTSWVEITCPVAEELNAIDCANGDTLYASGDEGTVLQSVDNGLSWTQKTVNNVTDTYFWNFYGLDFSDGKNGMVVGSGGLVYTTSNAGATWTYDSTTIVSSYLYDVDMLYSTKAYVVGNDGAIAKYQSANDPVLPLLADFTSNVTSGEAPLLVQFTDESEGEITTWNWDFGNGNTSTEQSPLHTYSSAGNYTVSLTVSNGTTSSTKTKTNYIQVVEPIVADFTVDAVAGVAPFSVQFQDLTSGEPTSWSWDFNNDGFEDSDEQNPSYTYTDAGTHSVKLTVSNGTNSDSIVKLDYIDVSSGACNDLSSDYIMNFEPGDDMSDWEIINSNNDEQQWGVFPDIGIGGTQCAAYQYSADNAADDWLISGCFDLTADVEYEISFYYKAYSSSFAEKLAIYYGTTQDASMSNLIYDFGEITNEDFVKSTHRISISADDAYYFGWHCYSDADKYALLIDSVVIKVADEIIEPVADFYSDVTSGQASLNVQFTDASEGEIESWNWDFGDGISSTEQSPLHLYAVPGTYSVSLTVTNSSGSSTETKTDYIEVVEAIAAEFSADVVTGNAPLEVQFNDLSFGTPTSWSWDFNNDGVEDSDEENPSYTYTEAGIYSVKLIVSNAYGSSELIKGDFIDVTEGSVVDQWYPIASNTANSLQSVRFYNDTHGWIAGWGNTLLRTTDGGLTWLPASSGISESMRDICFVNENIGWAVGSNGFVAKTTDGGNTWVEQEIDSGAALFTVCFIDENNGYIAGEFGMRFITTDGGTNWTSQGNADFNNIFDMQYVDGTLYQVGYQHFYESTDNGLSWTVKASFNHNDYLWNVHFLNTEIGYIAGNNNDTPEGFVLKTSDGGTNWTKLLIGEEPVKSVHFINETIGYAVGGPYSDGYIWKTTDGGATWVEDDLQELADYNFNDVSFVTPTIGFAVGTEGLIYRIEKSSGPLPTADFVIDTTMGTIPLTVKFKQLSTGMVSAWSWDFNNDGIEDSSEPNPEYVYEAEGEYTVSLTVTNNQGSTTETKENFVVVTPIGVNQGLSSTLSLFPNPVQSSLTIKSSEEIKLIKVYNVQGKMVYSSKAIDKVCTLVVDVSAFDSGIYYITTDNQHFTKVIKQ